MRCLAAAAQDLDHVRREGGTKAGDDLLGARVFQRSECEAVVEVADELERMMRWNCRSRPPVRCRDATLSRRAKTR